MIYTLLPIHIVDADTTDVHYEIDYEVLTTNNESVSVANDYFEKPRLLIVKEDERSMQMRINHNNRVAGLQASVGDDFADVHMLAENEKEETDSDTNELNKKDSGIKAYGDDIKGAGVNAGTMIVIVLLIGITVVLLYSFVFKRKK